MARSTKSSGKRGSASGSGATSATQLLRKDHQTVKQLFERFEKAGDRAYETKQRLFSEIENELDTHATIEEEIFYPAVQEEVSGAQDIVSEAIEEHNVVNSLLREIGAMSAEDEQFDAKVKVLQENVEHHVEEEEGEMFPKVERELTAERLQELGAELEARKSALGQPALKRIVSGVTGLIFGNGESKAAGSDTEAEGEERSQASRASGSRGGQGQRRSGAQGRARSTQRASEGRRSQQGSKGNDRSRGQQSGSGGRRTAAKATTGSARTAKKASGRSEARKRSTATAKKRGIGRSSAARATANRRTSKKRGAGTSASAKRRTSARKSARKR